MVGEEDSDCAADGASGGFEGGVIGVTCGVLVSFCGVGEAGGGRKGPSWGSRRFGIVGVL